MDCSSIIHIDKDVPPGYVDEEPQPEQPLPYPEFPDSEAPPGYSAGGFVTPNMQ